MDRLKIALCLVALMITTSLSFNPAALARNYHETSPVGQSGDDTSPPYIKIYSPTESEAVSGRVRVYYASFDSGGIEKYELYVDGVLKQTILSTARNQYFIWNASKEEGGTHTLVCKAYDFARNVGTSEPVNVNVGSSQSRDK